ncbi:MAG: helix-turn-helix domain-containing protein [Gemmatimonadaceae bacterium]
MHPLSLDPYVIDTLMPDLVGHDRQPSAFLVYLLLWRHTHGAAAGACFAQLPLLDIAEATGLSKRSVQDALARLANRGLVRVHRAGITAVGEYTVLAPWRERRRTTGARATRTSPR